MEAIAYYLFRSSVWLTGFGLVYLLFLRNERFFLLNRIYLVTGMLVSLIFPLFTWHYTVVLPVTPSLEVFQPQMTGVPVVDVESSYSFSYQDGLWIAYIIGVSIMLFKVVSQLLSVRKVIVQSGVKSFDTVRLVRSDRYPASFSFFSFVFVNPSVTDIEMGEIINHEQEHIRQRHWIDLLILEAVTLVQWFNPVVWLYGRMIRQNHEYLADEGALQRSQNPAAYRAALLNQMFGGSVISLSNSFNYSINKKRFYMMKKTISSPIRKLKLLLVLPLIAGVFYAFAAPEYQFVQVENESVKAEVAPEGSEVIAAQLNAITAQASVNEVDPVQGQPNTNASTAMQVVNKIVIGKVVDEAGNPLDMAGIRIYDKTGQYAGGSVTDQNGRFARSIQDGASMSVALPGYISQTVTPENGKELLVVLKKEGGTLVDKKASAGVSSSIVKGKVVDEAGNPLSFVNIVEVDENGRNIAATVTDQSGNFVSKVKESSTLDVVLPDYQKQKITPETGKELLVVLKKEGGTSVEKKASTGVSSSIVKGKVVDEDGNPLSFVNIVEVDENGRNIAATVTDQSGNFVSKVIGENKLQVSFVGYQTQKLDPDFKNEMKVILVRSVTSLKAVTVEATNPNEQSVYKKPLIVIDGKIAENQDASAIKPENIQSMSVLKGESATALYGDKAKDGAIVISLKKAATTDSDDKVFFIVEEMPLFPGGDQALLNYINASLKYPQVAKENGIQGKVTVSFVVSKTGDVKNAKVIRTVDPSLDEEALRIVNSLPKFKPGKQGGKAVDVAYTIPVNFVLPSNTVIGYPLNNSATGSTIQIRATGSTIQNGNTNNPDSKPLIVVDGKIAENQNVSAINPENIQSVNVLKPESATSKYGDKAKDGVIEITLKNTATTSDEKVFFIVEEMPQFPGGDAALLSYLAQQIKYPVVAQQKGIQGKVMVNFVVSKTGDVKNAKVIRSVDPLLDEEALRIVNSLPKWKPGKQGGKAVDVAYTIPVNFVLAPTPNSAAQESDATVLLKSADGNKPVPSILIVVDGKTFGTLGGDFDLKKAGVNEFGKLISIAPENIKSIGVLKDQNSIAVYGEKGKNGVLVITTKSAGQKTEEKTQVQATTMKKLVIVPNPASNQATITAEDMKVPTKLDVSVYDPFGKLIKKEQKNGPTFILTVSDLANGTYLVVANDGSQPYSGSLVVTH